MSSPQQMEWDRQHQPQDLVCEGPAPLLVPKAISCQHRDQYSECRSQHRALLPVTHQPRNSEMHDNDCCDLPPAPVLAAMKEEDPPEGVKENQHHGHKSCREKKRRHQAITHLT